MLPHGFSSLRLPGQHYSATHIGTVLFSHPLSPHIGSFLQSFLFTLSRSIITHITSVINAATIFSHIWNSNAGITFETNSYPRQSHNLIHSAYQERNDHSNFNSFSILVRFLHTFFFFCEKGRALIKITKFIPCIRI